MPKNVKYKFLRQPDRRKRITSQHGTMTWRIGEWNSVKGRIDLCNNGLHCSDTILDALYYVKGEVLAEVEVRGESDVQDDKSAWSEMRIVKAYRWTKEDSVAFAIYAAEQVVKIYEDKYPGDNRPRDAIRAAKAYLKDPTKKNARAADAAAYAAYAAARAAARAADAAAYAAYAAYAAARAAADAAARAADAAARAAARAAADAAADAAYAAARAAADAAYAEMKEKLNRWLKRRIKKLQEIER